MDNKILNLKSMSNNESLIQFKNVLEADKKFVLLLVDKKSC